MTRDAPPLRVLFFVGAPRQNASSRYRAYAYPSLLAEHGAQCRVSSPLSLRYTRRLRTTLNRCLGDQNSGRLLARLETAVSRGPGFVHRAATLTYALRADVVVIQTMLIAGTRGTILERLLFGLRRPVVYDIDDALYLSPTIGRKVDYLMRRASAVVASTEAIADYARDRNANVSVISDPMDFSKYTRALRPATDSPVVIGWVGTSRNAVSLQQLAPVLSRLQTELGLIVRVVSSEPIALPGVSTEFREWSLGTEINDIQSLDIGLNPMPETAYASAKNSLKLQQYLSVGLPAVTSPGGLDRAVYRQDDTVLLAETPEDWYTCLRRLVVSPKLRKRIGDAGRREMQRRYALDIASSRLLVLLRDLVEEPHAARR